jgi:hypothetical protein
MDIFFTQSAAALYGVSDPHFRRLLPTLDFIVRLPGGQIATVAASVTAAREQRTDARRGSIPRYQFNGGYSLKETGCSAGTCYAQPVGEITGVSSGCAVPHSVR